MVSHSHASSISTICTLEMQAIGSLFAFLVASASFFRARSLPFDYPTANLSTVWTNSASLEHVANYSDGSAVRAILLRGSFGPSFACGFYCSGLCDAFLFAVFIVYTNSGSRMTNALLAPPQVVWSANRDRPVGENATLQLSVDGNLLLRDADSTTVWHANTTGRAVVGMNVTDTGSLVLFSKNNDIIWNSADHPTDSWVLGQTLTEGRRLTANVSAANWTQGPIYLSIAPGGIKAYVDSTPPQLYYQYGFTETGLQNGSTKVTFTNGSLAIFTSSTTPNATGTSISLPPANSVQYMRLESDGHLRLYEWSDNNGWKVENDVMNIYPDDCAYPTVCGAYGICSNAQCSCPSDSNRNSSYFRQVDPRQANLGCYLANPLSCGSDGIQQLLALSNVSYFNYIDPDAVAIARTDEDSCKRACLSNCSCKAAFFQYGANASDGSCYLPSQLFSMMNNRPILSHFNSSAYIKVQNLPSVSTSNEPNNPSGLKKNVKIAVIVTPLCTVALVIGFILILAGKKKAEGLEEEDQLDMVPGIPTRFSFEELRAATTNFYKKLGEGGFGSVFEGTLSNGTRVAVKQLEGVGQGKKEFLAEVKSIGSVHHINLVRLIGFCAEKSHRLLVYEYMCNGSLDQWIFYKDRDVALDWQTRRKIITDIAKGLSYLHEECRQRIVHLDIKPQNILLDEEFNAKVSDFGLSKLIDRDQSQVMTRMRGTPGYLAPEWLTSLITEKADVYSFGVVVMEIACGRKNLDYSQPEESIHLLSLLQEKMEDDRLLDAVDNRSTDMRKHGNEVVEIMKLAMWCLQSDPNRRPSMSTVLKVLEGSTSVDSNIDYKFSTPDPFTKHKSNNLGDSPLPSASLLSGPR